MKKFLAIILAVVLMLSLSVVALADDEEFEDVSTITITKTFTDVNGGVSPAETFSFSDFETVEILENDAAEFPETLPTIDDVSFDEGEATASKTATITLPEYDAVGIYVYSFTEEAGNTAGVTYNSDTFYLVVTVIEQDGKVRVAAVHCEGGYEAGTYGEEPKTDEFENTYESGTLEVTKAVTGKLGDKTKYFEVTVTFTPADGEVINSTITYSGGQYAQDVTVENNTATFQVKDSDTITFTNIPEGVTWEVEEADYSNDGYDTTYDAATGTIAAGDADTCTITNDKDTTPDTGITLDSLPYILIGMVVLAAAVAMILNKRRNNAF
ncbi:MAG: hypothetical protein IKQ64_03535 [Bacteroidales bacterium]|nr:hypothetical protein [Bacteroidales bacterium]